MSLQIRSVRSARVKCRDCQSDNVSQASDYGEFYNICHDCGVLFMIDEELEVTASIMKCPHCESVDAIVANGGDEVCNICGLDPNEEEYESGALAHLWKSRGPEHEEEDRLIREVMLSEKMAKFRTGSNIGNFLRSSCGPHCPYAASCPQTTKNFSRCYREETSTWENEMGKRKRKSKGKNKAAKALRKAKKQAWQRLHSRAWLFAASGGWYVRSKKYATETDHQEQYTT